MSWTCKKCKCENSDWNDYCANCGTDQLGITSKIVTYICYFILIIIIGFSIYKMIVKDEVKVNDTPSQIDTSGCD